MKIDIDCENDEAIEHFLVFSAFIEFKSFQIRLYALFTSENVFFLRCIYCYKIMTMPFFITF